VAKTRLLLDKIAKTFDLRTKSDGECDKKVAICVYEINIHSIYIYRRVQKGVKILQLDNHGGK